MRRYLSILRQIFPWYLYQVFINRFRPNGFVELPKKINSFTLKGKLSQKSRPYATGVYLSSTGNEVVAKVWSGKIKDIYYFNLLHQIKMLKILTEVSKRLPKNKTYGFSTPKHIMSIEHQNQVILVMEMVKGKTLREVRSQTEQFAVYSKCLLYLDALSKKLTSDEKKLITTKSVWDFIVLYPLILAAAIALNPRVGVTLIKGSIYFLIGIPALLKIKPNALVHGDIHQDNIIVTGKNKFSLIDTENMRLCYPMYESISTISLKHNPKPLKDLVIKRFIKPLTLDKSNRAALRSLLINNLTHYLSGDRNEAGIVSYVSTLNIAFAL